MISALSFCEGWEYNSLPLVLWGETHPRALDLASGHLRGGLSPGPALGLSWLHCTLPGAGAAPHSHSLFITRDGVQPAVKASWDRAQADGRGTTLPAKSKVSVTSSSRGVGCTRASRDVWFPLPLGLPDQNGGGMVLPVCPGTVLPGLDVRPLHHLLDAVLAWRLRLGWQHAHVQLAPGAHGYRHGGALQCWWVRVGRRHVLWPKPVCGSAPLILAFVTEGAGLGGRDGMPWVVSGPSWHLEEVVSRTETSEKGNFTDVLRQRFAHFLLKAR